MMIERKSKWQPKLRRLKGEPGRCWKLSRRDRLAWWFFTRIANPSVAHTMWQEYRFSRDCESVTWNFGDGTISMFEKDLHGSQD